MSFVKEHESFVVDSKPVETFDYQKNPLLDIYPDLVKDIKSKDFLDEISFLDLLKMQTKDFQYSLKSSLNFSNSLAIKITKEPLKLSNQSLVSLDFPYKILFYHSQISGKLHLFVKGQKLMMNYSEDIIELINRLNTHEKIKVVDLLQDLFQEWPEELTHRLLEILYEKNGLLNIEGNITVENSVFEKSNY